jgi:iron only hydrogenase large subunit-like protein
MLEALGVKSGAISTGKLVILLKMLGIDYVFGTNNSADMNDNC